MEWFFESVCLCLLQTVLRSQWLRQCTWSVGSRIQIILWGWPFVIHTESSFWSCLYSLACWVAIVWLSKIIHYWNDYHGRFTCLNGWRNRHTIQNILAFEQWQLHYITIFLHNKTVSSMRALLDISMHIMSQNFYDDYRMIIKCKYKHVGLLKF